MTEAKVICDSLNEFGQRITTMIVTFPRFLLAEFNTHRMLSRNSASSRAIRFETMVKSVQENPFIPIAWQKDHAGMQGTEYFENVYIDGNNDALNIQDMWLHGRNDAVIRATALNKYGVTKQLANRMLEPYMMHTCLVTATEWENFFALRAHEHAEIHFQDLANKMLVAMNESEPKQLKAGEWHIPFGDQFEHNLLKQIISPEVDPQAISIKGLMEIKREYESLKIKLSTVRCARLSYLTQDKITDYSKDLELHDRLSQSGHWSAFEHCAQAMTSEEFDLYTHEEPRDKLKPVGLVNRSYGWCGNFRGFIQYRKMFETENRSDERLIQK
jgi:thymidylate synthase ThyX